MVYRAGRFEPRGSTWWVACLATGLAAGCFPALSEPGDAAAGAGGGVVHGTAGFAGVSPKAGTGGRIGTTGTGGSATRGGAGASVSTGGGPVGTGAVSSQGCGGSAGRDARSGESGDGVGAPPPDAVSGAGGEGGRDDSSAGGRSGGAGHGGSASTPTQAELEAQSIERWNQIADYRSGDTYRFHWTLNAFPHPTFAAMGEADGYREFAGVLDDFLGLNFDFLATNHQFLVPHVYGTASSSDEDLVVTWDGLADDFSTMSYGDIADDVQSRLAQYRLDMQAYEP